MKDTQGPDSPLNKKKDVSEPPARFKRVTKRQKQIIRTRLSHPNESHKEIANRLGVKQPYVSKELAKPHVKAKMSDILDAAGVTDEAIAKKINQLQNAKKKTYFASFGRVVSEREDEDAHLQLAATNLAAELKGHKQKKVDVTSNGDTIRALLLEDD